jgi:hypothetical protein
VGEEASEGSHVLLVVDDDRSERVGAPAPEEVEVAAGDLPAADVVDPANAEELPLDRGEPVAPRRTPEQAPNM